jgi:hypothetical protein
VREETQVRERVERLIRENETLRQQAARHLLANEWHEAQAILDRISHNESTARALGWALGGQA